MFAIFDSLSSDSEGYDYADDAFYDDEALDDDQEDAALEAAPVRQELNEFEEALDEALNFDQDVLDDAVGEEAEGSPDAERVMNEIAADLDEWNYS